MTRRVDRGVLFSFLLLLLTGLVVLYAASYYNAQDDGNALSEVVSQLVGIGVGAAMMLVILRLDYRKLNNPAVTLTLVGVSIVLLILVAIPGVVIFGVLLAVAQRFREIEKGEADDAKQY